MKSQKKLWRDENSELGKINWSSKFREHFESFEGIKLNKVNLNFLRILSQNFNVRNILFDFMFSTSVQDIFLNLCTKLAKKIFFASNFSEWNCKTRLENSAEQIIFADLPWLIKRTKPQLSPSLPKNLVSKAPRAAMKTFQQFSLNTQKKGRISQLNKSSFEEKFLKHFFSFRFKDFYYNQDSYFYL